MAPKDDLPLKYFTPESWAESAVKDLDSLLNDHAHLEKKAAANALEMLLRWPDPSPPENWVSAMTSIASDEVAHLNSVTRLLSRRGGKLSRSHRNGYAKLLRGEVRSRPNHENLIDRLLVSALIEARSCERFFLLSKGVENEELSRLYETLYKSEAGHYRVFLTLARELPKSWAVDERWQEFLNKEAEFIQMQAPGSTMHSGI